jgi:hypothetical protein
LDFLAWILPWPSGWWRSSFGWFNSDHSDDPLVAGQTVRQSGVKVHFGPVAWQLSTLSGSPWRPQPALIFKRLAEFRGRGAWVPGIYRSTSLQSAPDRAYDVPPADKRKGEAKAESERYLGKPIITHRYTLTRYPAGTMAPSRQKNVAGSPARLSECSTARVSNPICWFFVGCGTAKMHRSLWRTIGARA